MGERFKTRNHSVSKRILSIALIALGAASALFVLPLTPASAATNSLTQTTIADFNLGNFYHTGLTRVASGGGDGDGEVRLLTVGISCNTWNSNGNVNGLPALQGHAAVQKNGYIYVSGGQIGLGNESANVYYTQINTTTHNLNNWTQTSALLGGSRKYHAMVEANNYLYVIGGLDATNGPTSTVLVAPINPNGSVGAWTATTPISASLSDLTSVVVSNTIYVIGGQSFAVTSTVYYATPNAGTGNISSWNLAASLPISISAQSSAVYSNTIYNAGGANFSTFQYYPDVNYAIPAASGNINAYTGTIPMQNNLYYGSGTAFAGQLYIAGGESNNGTANLTNTIASNVISPTGALSGSWTNSNCLSSPRKRAASVMSNDGWLYVIEGNASTALAPLNSVDYGPTTVPSGQYIPSGNFQSSIIDLGAGAFPVSIDWNAFVSTTVTMTLQYRIGNNSDLSDGVWSNASGATTSNSAAQTSNVPINSSTPYRYVQYRVTLGNNNNSTQTPVLNSVTIHYNLFDFAITHLAITGSTSSSQVISYTFSYSVENKSSQAAPIRSPNAPSQPSAKQPIINLKPPPPPPPLVGKAPLAPNTNYPYFWVWFYYDHVPTGPNDSTHALNWPNCVDVTPGHASPTTAPFIWYTLELFQAPSAFQAQCTIPTGAMKFYAQIDACDGSIADPSCNSYGYVRELDEIGNLPSYADNIFGPVSRSSLLFPLIMR